MSRDLSFIIPARNERWLARTCADILSHITADSEIIVVLDGAWPETGYELPQHERITVIYLPESIGQRAATNLAIKISSARYICKVDAHVAIAPGMDAELISSCEPDWTMIPAQMNLHAFDWVCEHCQHRSYQGPTPVSCVACGVAGPFRMDIVWNAVRRRTEYWRFDSDLHFQYWGSYQERPESRGEIVDVMTSLGACFFMARDRFWQLGGLDEQHGSWGQLGVEVACKSWLSGGRHVVDKRTWFSHLFRTQGSDFGFPYAIAGSDQERARAYSRKLWRENAWPGQVRPLRWLLEKFAAVPGWTDEQIAALPEGLFPRTAQRHDLGNTPRDRGTAVVPAVHVTVTKGCVWYTDNQCPEPIGSAVRAQLAKVAPGPIVAVSLAPLDFGRNITLPLTRGYLTMFRQILAGLEALDTEIAFLVEHDVLYAADHFAFTPARADRYYYNQHVWKVDAVTGRALHYRCSQTSGLCANRELLIAHYRKRIARVEVEGYSRQMGFEPGTHRRSARVDDVPAETWMSETPNIDIRHGGNLTPSRWRRDQFRNQTLLPGLAGILRRPRVGCDVESVQRVSCWMLPADWSRECHGIRRPLRRPVRIVSGKLWKCCQVPRCNVCG